MELTLLQYEYPYPPKLGELMSLALGILGNYSAQDKYAVLGPGDNLGRLAKQYNVTVADIVRWNGVRDPRHLRVGSQLIVQKGVECGRDGQPMLSTQDHQRQQPANSKRSARRRGRVGVITIILDFGLSKSDPVRRKSVTCPPLGLVSVA